MSTDPDFEVNLNDEVAFGSDQERALTNAIDVVFGGSKRKLCQLHLKKNLIYYMRVSLIYFY